MPPKVIVNPEPVVVETTMDCDSDYEDYAMHEVVVPPVRVRIRHKPDCKFTPEMVELLKKKTPTATIITEVGEEDEFEFFANDKLVYSKRHLRKYPKNKDELVEVTRWMNKGKTFMHMYLCTVAEGGEPKMVIADRKNTPLAKRLILACTIQ